MRDIYKWMSSAILLIVWSALLPLSLSRDDMALTCQPITNATMCFNMNWNYTSLPNARDHSDQQEASGELNHFLPLIRQQCSNAIVHFLCSVYIPYCTNVGENIGSSTSLTLDPCREVCEYVRKGCEPFYHNYSTLSWPPHLMCERFPVAQPCFNITDIESVHIPLGLQLMTPTNISGSIVSEPWQYHDGSSVSYTSKSSSTITITTSNISTSHSDIISTTSIEAYDPAKSLVYEKSQRDYLSTVRHFSSSFNTDPVDRTTVVNQLQSSKTMITEQPLVYQQSMTVDSTTAAAVELFTSTTNHLPVNSTSGHFKTSNEPSIVMHMSSIPTISQTNNAQSNIPLLLMVIGAIAVVLLVAVSISICIVVAVWCRVVIRKKKSAPELECKDKITD